MLPALPNTVFCFLSYGLTSVKTHAVKLLTHWQLNELCCKQGQGQGRRQKGTNEPYLRRVFGWFVRSVANLHVNKTINSQCARFYAKNKICTRAAAKTKTIRTTAINRK